MAEEKPLDTRSIRLEVKVPCDERFRPVLSVLCERMARYVGYPTSAASEIAETVVHATDGVLAHEEAPEYTSLDVTIATSETEIEFRVRYLAEGGPSDDHVDIERLLSRQRDDGVPLDIMQRVMKRVEFGRDEGVEFCALRHPLPEEL